MTSAYGERINIQKKHQVYRKKTLPTVHETITDRLDFTNLPVNEQSSQRVRPITVVSPYQ